MLVKLSQYIRNCIYRHIRPIYILDHCEKCGSDKNLHLHHERQFADMLNEALKRLNIKYKIYKLILSKKDNYSTGVHFGPLFCQPWTRNLQHKQSDEYKRDYIQIKWYSLKDDIIGINDNF